MSTLTTRKIVYPESDSLDMPENTRHARYVVLIYGGLDALFRDRPDVFVAMDNYWYPVQGHPEIRIAPDVYVAFGRPKGDRSSYQQWDEGGVAPQVVFEVRSPANGMGELTRKFNFYERYGVEEYYFYDPKNGELSGWIRDGSTLADVPTMEGHTSPRLGIRFATDGDELLLFRPDGRPFESFADVVAQRDAYAAKLRELGVDPDTL